MGCRKERIEKIKLKTLGNMTLEEVSELNIAKINSRKQCCKIGGSGDNR